MEINDKVRFKGTKSCGTDWNNFINSSYFKPRTKEDIYGIVFALGSSESIWCHIYDLNTNQLLDTSTWSFKEEDLIKD